MWKWVRCSPVALARLLSFITLYHAGKCIKYYLQKICFLRDDAFFFLLFFFNIVHLISVRFKQWITKRAHWTFHTESKGNFTYPQSVREINKLPLGSFKNKQLSKSHSGRLTHTSFPPGNQIPVKRIFFIVLVFLLPRSFVRFHLRSKSSK